MKNFHVITTCVRLIHCRTMACHPFQFVHKLTQVCYCLPRRCTSAQAGLSCNFNQPLHRLFQLKSQHFRCGHPSTLRRSNPLRKPRGTVDLSNRGKLSPNLRENSQFLRTSLPDFNRITNVQDCTCFIHVRRFNNMLHVFHCCICYIDHSLHDKTSFCVCIRKINDNF